MQLLTAPMSYLCTRCSPLFTSQRQFAHTIFASASIIPRELCVSFPDILTRPVCEPDEFSPWCLSPPEVSRLRSSTVPDAPGICAGTCAA